MLPSLAEYALRVSTQSMVTSVQLHPMDKFLVAATMSGELLCFDLRDGGDS